MRRVVLLVAVLLLAGCGVDFWAFESVQNTDRPRSTLLLVWLADSPVDGADALEVTLEGVALVRDDGIEPIASAPQTLDLLGLRNGARAKVAEAEVPAGAYRAVRVTLREGGALGPRMRTGGVWEPLPFTGPGRNVIEVPFALTHDADRAEIHIDFNARLSVHETPDGPRLDPRLDAVDASSAGEIAGVVRDAAGAPVADALVVVRRGGLEVRSTTSMPDGSYRLPWLAPGTYDVEILGPGGPLAASPGVLVAAGAAETVAFTLP